MYQLLTGLDYLHDRKIAHRGTLLGLKLEKHFITLIYRPQGVSDYLSTHCLIYAFRKPENILLHVPGPYPRIQIADFGLARPKSYQETFNVCGTVSYLPPEGILALDQKHLGYVG
jgi:meiosis-specific serine/threonine-protein kinase MEK1